MIIQCHNPGNGGRLGNMLFNIASTIGIALRHGAVPRFPDNWQYRHIFNIPDDFFGDIRPGRTCNEKHFHYDPHVLRGFEHYPVVNLHGYFQSPKYWQGYEEQIKEWLTPKGVDPGSYDAVSLHFRRGDYVGNPNYAQLPMAYYLNGLEHYNALNYIAHSDDRAFLQLHFPNHHYHVNEVDDFINMVRCNRHIVSNSTFAWWAAYLSRGEVVRPSIYFDGALRHYSTLDFWLDDWHWMPSSPRSLQRVTFVIPVKYDHQDRYENLAKVIRYLHWLGFPEIIIGEINGDKFKSFHDDNENIRWVGFNMSHFHRTKVINDLTRMASNDIVFNWDADVFASPFNIWRAFKMLQHGWADIVYPYGGAFYWLDRSELKNAHDGLSAWAGRIFKRVGSSPIDKNSYGGAVAYNRAYFFDAGGENENFVSYGAEDAERYHRFNVLGLRVERVPGGLYHIDHYRGPDSSFAHEHGKRNNQYWNFVKTLSKQQYLEHIKTWTWLK